MSTPNVICQIYFLDNEKSLAKNEIRQAKYGNQRKFYSCQKAYNYVDYVNIGSKQALNYVEYSGNNEKSHGVFNANGLLTKEEQKLLKKQLRETQSVIWHGFISFTESFGNMYCNDYESAYKMMKVEFPRFLKSAGLNPDNIIWYAGLHENTDNRHIHFSFFEKEPTKFRERSTQKHFSNGKLPYWSIEQLKLRVEQSLTDSAAQLKFARKQLTDSTKNVLFSKQSPLKYNQEIQTLMCKLLEELPETGRFSYDSENIKPYKGKITKIVNAIICSNKDLYNTFTLFCRQVAKKDKETLRILSNLKIKPENWDKYLISEKYLKDIYRRLGNQVLNSLRIYKSKLQKSKSRLVNKRINKTVKANLLLYCIKLNAQIEDDATKTFEEYLKKLQETKENNIEEVQYEMD